jgi:dTDP-4-amino-4,6-dideoxygalactose transaminase
MTHAPYGDWYYQQVALGYNYRMTDIQAALGMGQLQRLEQYIERRHALAKRYDKLLVDLPVTRPYLLPECRSSMHLYPIQFADSDIRSKVFEYMREEGVGVNVHYIPVHTHPYYQRIGFKSGDFPQAEAYYKRTISLPLFPTMTEMQQDQVIFALHGALKVPT